METMTSESPHVLGEATLAELRTRMLGPVIATGDPGYENARRIWNGAIDMHPALVLRCSGVARGDHRAEHSCPEFGQRRLTEEVLAFRCHRLHVRYLPG